MKHYYEVGHHNEVVAFDTFEEAEQFANKNGCTIISEIGGSWDDYEKCAFCDEWYTASELNEYGDCYRCEQAMKDHGGYRPPNKD